MNMPVAPHFHKPRAGEKFWDRSVFLEENGAQPNGTIRHVNWPQKEVMVEFLDKDKTIRTYDVEDILGCWEGDKFGGCWMLYPRLTREDRLKMLGEP